MKLKGEKLLHADMQITEVIIPVKETLTKARSYGVSITVFLTAMLLCSIHEGDTEEPSEEADCSDDSSKSEKLFSITVHGKFLWMD